MPSGNRRITGCGAVALAGPLGEQGARRILGTGPPASGHGRGAPEPVNPETRMLRRPTGRIDLISTRPKGSQACRRVVAGLGGSQAADLDALTSDSANAWLLDELWSGVPRCDPETLARDLDTVAAMRTLGLGGASEPCEEPVRDTLGALTRETDTVRMLRALNLPDELFDHLPRNQFTAWRAQAMRIPPGELSAEPYECA